MLNAEFAVILAAAGRSARFGGARSKLLEPLAGEPVILHSARAFLSRGDVAFLIIAAPPADSSALEQALEKSAHDPRVRFCAGGGCRAESVRNALREIPQEIQWVAVHDAARPLVSQALLDRTFRAACEQGAAVPALPVTLTIKQALGPLPARVQATLPRQSLWAMQTPQVLPRATLLAAFESCPLPLDQITDDAQALELAGHEVWLVEGEERNIKITTQSDLTLAELLIGQKYKT